MCYAADHAAVTALITFCFSPVANSNITCLCADQTVADLGSGLQTTKADVESLKASQKTLTTQLEALNNRLSLLEVVFLALGLSPCLFVRLPFLGIICLVVGFGKIHSALALKVFVKKNPQQPKTVSISVILVMCVQTGFRQIHKVKVSKRTDGKGVCKTRHFLPLQGTCLLRWLSLSLCLIDICHAHSERKILTCILNLQCVAFLALKATGLKHDFVQQVEKIERKT